MRLAVTSTALAVAAGAVGLVRAVGYGHATHYRDDFATVFFETTLVALGCEVAIRLGRRLLTATPAARA